MPDPFDSLLTGENAAFVDALYRRWCADPAEVDARWAELFTTWPADNGASPTDAPSFRSRSIFDPAGRGAPATQGDVLAAAQRQARVAQLINAYRVQGHHQASIDPLQRHAPPRHPELTLDHYGLGVDDLDVPVSSRPLFGIPEITTLRHIVDRLERAYCGGFGIEYMNVTDTVKKVWLQERVETLQDRQLLDRTDQMHVLRLLLDAENFERLLHNRYPGTKRFSLEGAETLIPLLDMLVSELARRGVNEILLGMSHRGRLNVMANILRKPVRQIVDEFDDVERDGFTGSGDVKYHLGYSTSYRTRFGDEVWLSMAFNPSHLEAVDPVVEGRVRARQDRRQERPWAQVVPLLLHGDAAFAGQGLVAETLNLSELRGYRTGGTMHVIVNNQIGFTTAPKDARSTPYCTDVARMLGVPIFHVNGEDVNAVAAVVEIAADWRQRFHQDVIIDMLCFRKHGHNEGDEPSFTQPLLYEAIRTHPSAAVAYARRMEERGDVNSSDVDRLSGESREELERLLHHPPDEAWDSYVGNLESEMGKVWAPFHGSLADPVDTTFPMDRLTTLLTRANTIPEGFHAHRKIQRLMERRSAIVAGEAPVDWAVAEQAAYATLVDQGVRVRLSGQDSGRGTFSHRHAVLSDIDTGDEFVPLAHLTDTQAPFAVHDSMLSEAAVLGFEFGYSLDCPDALVLWEAQFGDFANGAQVIIDNFIMATEQKWNRFSGIVMLLPHGMEGQGPEHSSARLERYLQLCAEDNMVVANCTTPANFFHLLRRQALQRVRKPLVVMAPKSLLRHAACVSTLRDLAEGAFQPVIDDTPADRSTIRRVVFCSGKVFYDLRAAREERGAEGVALVRMDQLYPFPHARIEALLASYPNADDVVWCQEEPRNMGAWPMMDEWMGEVLDGHPPRYIGRKRSASPATGSSSTHRAEQAALIDAALTIETGAN